MMVLYFSSVAKIARTEISVVESTCFQKVVQQTTARRIELLLQVQVQVPKEYAVAYYTDEVELG